MSEPQHVASGKQALAWMLARCAGPGQVLFRGQSKVWPDIRPSITRPDVDKNTQRALWKICRRFVHVAQLGLTGYRVNSVHDRLAILQHYILRSPVIDLTRTPEIALYFALLGAQPGSRCVIYAVDVDVVRRLRGDDVEVTDHQFLAMPLDAGGAAHRWLRQDGFTIGPKAWREPTAVEAFDLLKLPGLATYHFTAAESDWELVARLGDLESIEADPLARAVRGLVGLAARDLAWMTPALAAVLKKTRTTDPHAELIEEIDALMNLATSTGDSAGCAEITKLREAATKSYWDASWECALAVWRRRLYASSAEGRIESNAVDAEV